MITLSPGTYKRRFLFIYLPTILLTALNSCSKYLDAKSDQSIVTPTTMSDLEGLLNSYGSINARYPSAAEVSSDSFYLTDADLNSLADRQRNFYLWQKSADIGADYTAPYQSIAVANIILETLVKVGSSDLTRYNQVKGNALFVRASYHFAIAQLFAGAYDKGTAGTEPGIALRFTSDPEVLPYRSSLAATYSAILDDLNQALPLLNDMPALKYKPGKAAVYALLSRVYLSMRNYESAEAYADSSLRIYSKLIDYNTVSTTATIPFAQFNTEVIYDGRSSPPSALTQSRARVDTLLYASYAPNDLRKAVFFKSNTNGSKAFKGNYTGLNNASVFSGLTTSELYLTKAECGARAGKVIDALQYINQLLTARWKTGTYVPVTITDPKSLLSFVLTERRKELIFRGTRWTDLRRLNKEAELSQTLYRKNNGGLYILKPNDARYVFQIDQNAVNISGMLQNP